MNKTISVLVADDNTELNNEMTDFIKTQPDMTAYQAFDGEEAFKMILETNPDVIILDLVMPKLDGKGLINKLNNTKLDKKPRIICIPYRLWQLTWFYHQDMQIFVC